MPSAELQRIFSQRTAAIYFFMGKRVAGGRDAAVELARRGACLPFTQPQFASWVLSCLGGHVERTAPCSYCNSVVNVATFVVDHRIPLGWPWYGSPGLPNLTLSCAPCNQRKGCMSDAGLQGLVQWASRSLDARDMADMLKRMGSGGMAARLLAERRASRPLGRKPAGSSHHPQLFLEEVRAA